MTSMNRKNGPKFFYNTPTPFLSHTQTATRNDFKDYWVALINHHKPVQHTSF